MPDLLKQLLRERPFLIADGATGTNLFTRGLETGDSPEMWNIDRPDEVSSMQWEFVEAGSDLILTNSFGCTRQRLKLHGADSRVGELNEAAARLTRTVADRAKKELGRTIVVAGSMGPTGEIMQPVGVLSHEEAVSAFAEQAQALKAGGVDVLWIETISSREEMAAAVEGASSADLPICATMTFDTNGRTMMGLGPDEYAGFTQTLSPKLAAFGANCGVGPPELLESLLKMAGVAVSGGVLIAKGNCGIPEYVDGEIVYRGTPELMQEYAKLALDAGARIIGGCCGTTAEHVSAMRRGLDGHDKQETPELSDIVARLGPVWPNTPPAVEGAKAERARRRRRRG